MRGDALPLLMALHMSSPSTGIGPVLSIFAGGRPAMAATVGYQSITCIILFAGLECSADGSNDCGSYPFQEVPTALDESRGEETIATPLTPPSHSVHFDPRNGQLFPASRKRPELVAPPLCPTARQSSRHIRGTYRGAMLRLTCQW